MTRRTPAAVLLLIALALSGCGETAAPSASTPTTACAPIDLKGPDGRAIDLSGRWSGNDQGLYDLKQVDNCLWWAGISNFPGQAPGEAWRNVFRGTIATDMTISGEFVDVFGTNPGTGTLKLRIQTQESEDGVEVQLTREAAAGHPYGGTFWERLPAEAPEPDESGEVLEPSAPPGSPPPGFIGSSPVPTVPVPSVLLPPASGSPAATPS